MKYLLSNLSAVLAALSLAPAAQASDPEYTNFIRQVQMETGVERDVSVAASGEDVSDLAIDSVGARFELWTVRSSPLTSYLLDTKYVGAYVPSAEVLLTSEDPYAEIPRTRADRPYNVQLTVGGLLSGAEDPEPSKSVDLLWHVQSYGADGDGIDIDRSQATVHYQTSIESNGTWNFTIAAPSIPGADRSKVRGEERFSIFSLEDYQAPASQLSSQFIQIWPVADGSISGLASNDAIKGAAPTFKLFLNDLYPDSQTYAQVYKGEPQLGTVGTVVPGSALNINDSVPVSDVLTISKWDEVLTEDGRWTMELLTATPFGTDRLAYVSFDVDRTIRVKGSVTTTE